MADGNQNKESMKEAIETLNQIVSSNSTPKTIKKSITDLIADLNNEEYYIVEPNIHEHNVFKLTDYKTAFEKADIAVFLVAHKEFKSLTKTPDKVVLDFCGIYK